MKTLAPNLLHPAIPLIDQENLEIADLGAGTGYVPLGTSSAYHGFDHFRHLTSCSWFLLATETKPNLLTYPYRLWACELSAALPSATFTLFDSASWLFPPSHLRPMNTRWIEHDCFSSFPVDCLGRFDIVNVRFWKCRINDDTVDFFFQNLFTLLSMFRPILQITMPFLPCLTTDLTELNHGQIRMNKNKG